MHRNPDKQVADHRQRAAENTDGHGVDDGPQQVRLLPDITEGRQREFIPERNPHPPVGDKRPQGYANQRHADSHG